MRNKLSTLLLTVAFLLNAQVVLANPTATADEEFARKAAADGKMEVELGRMAARKGRNPAVRNFGRRMVTDHTRSGNKLKVIARKKGITLPAVLDPMHNEGMTRLAGLSGADFDRAYMEMMVSDHEKAVAEFEAEASSGSVCGGDVAHSQVAPRFGKANSRQVEIKEKLPQLFERFFERPTTPLKVNHGKKERSQ